MAIYDFTGANGDPLPVGLSAYNGTQEIQSNALVATSLPSGPQLNQCGADSTADGTFQAVFNANGSTASGVTGVYGRRSNNDNSWQVLISPSDGTLRLFKLVAASYTEITPRYTIPSFNASTDYTIALVCSGTSIAAHIGGVSQISTTDSFNQTEINAGIRFGTLLHSIDDLNIPDAAGGDSITVSEAFLNNAVYTMQDASTSAVSFDISYTGTPTALEYRVLDARDDTTEVSTWATFDASPSGGVSTLAFNAPKNLFGMHVEVRFSNDTGVTSLQTLDWYAGMCFVFNGQSLADRMSTVGSITASLGHLHFNGTVFAAPTTGAGEKQFVDQVQAMYGCAVAVTNPAVGGSPMTFEADSDTNNWSNPSSTLFTDAVSYVGGMTNGVNRITGQLMIQGQRDSIQNVSYATYRRINELGGLHAFLTNSRNAWKWYDGTTLPITLGTLGRNTTTSTDAKAQEIRDALMTVSQADELIVDMPLFHVATSDQLHPTVAGYESMGDAYAYDVAASFGDVTAGAPRVISITNNAGYTEFTLEFDRDLDTSDTVYSNEGVRVEDNGSPVTVTSFTRTTARKAVIVLGSAVVTTSEVRFFSAYGTGAGLANTTLIYPRGAAATLPGTGGTYSPYACNFNILADELV